MIKQITIENYQGIDKKKTISFLANAKRKKDKMGIVKKNGKEILLTAALMGKNASGKTSFIEGIHFLEGLCGGNIYLSILSYLQSKNAKDSKKIILDSEIIDFLLKREFHDPKKSIKFSLTFIDSKTELRLDIELKNDGNIIEKIYQDNILLVEHEQFLKTFQSKHFDKSIKLKRVQFQNIYDIFEEAPIINWIKAKDSKFWNKNIFLEWIKIADDKIVDVDFVEDDVKYFYIKDTFNNIKKINVGKLSKGTLKWVNIANFIFVALFKTQTFTFFDEIERSLHPGLARFLINIFNNSYINKKKSQLLFTTHSPNILEENFRKDAINFIDDNGEIVNLGNDLNIREDLSVSKNYYAEKLFTHPNKEQMFDFLENIDD